jgi:Organic solute transporter Ostalpha
MVIRIMLMVPIYAVSSLISLFSLEAAFVIDAIRDIYEVRRTGFHYPLDDNPFPRRS